MLFNKLLAPRVRLARWPCFLMCAMARVMAALLWGWRSRVQAKQPPQFPAFCTFKWEFTESKSQPGGVTGRMWAPDSLHPSAVVFQSRRWSRGFALFVLCSGFGFLGKGLSLTLSVPRQGGGEQVLRIFCRQVPNTHWKLHVTSSYWSCSAQTAGQDIDIRQRHCKDSFPSKDESTHISSESCFLL